MSITRIQNNQITDSTIVSYAKLQPGSITGNLFAPTVTIGGNVTILGNLTLSNVGNTTTLNSTNTFINDPIVTFNNGYNGTLSGYDIGMLVNRSLASLASYGSVNTAWVWVENDQAFEAIATTSTATNSTTLTNSGWANIKVGNSAVTGALTVAGPSYFSSNVYVSANIVPTTALTYSLGAADKPFSELYLSGSTIFLGNASISNADGNVAIVGPSGNKLIVSNTGSTQVGNLSVSGNITAGVPLSSVHQLLGNVVIGTGNGVSGALTALEVNNNNATPMNSTSTVHVWGVSGASSKITNDTTASSSAQTSMFVARTAAGTISSPAAVSSGQLLGAFVARGYGATGFKIANPAQSTGMFVQAAQSYTDTNQGAQLYFTTTPLNSNVAATSMWIDTTGNVVIPTTTASTTTQTGALIVAGGVGVGGAIYASGLGQLGGGLQNTAIGNATPYTAAFTTLTASGLTTITNSTAGGSGSGALVVTGGASVGGALYAGSVYDNSNRVLTSLGSSGAGNLTVTISAPASSTIALTATGPGAGTWGSATNLGSVTTDIYGRVVAASNTALNTIVVTQAGNTANITANNAYGLVGWDLTNTAVTAGVYGDGTHIPQFTVDSKGRVISASNIALSSGSSFTVAGTTGTTTVAAGSTFTYASTNGVTIAVGAEYANISTPQDIQTTASPTFNALTVTNGLSAGSINNTPIGAGTANTGAFTTLTASSGTQATGSGTGALQVTGGASVGGNLWVGGNLSVNGTLTYINTIQEILTGSEIVAGTLTANSGTASTSTTTGALQVLGGAGITGIVNASAFQGIIGNVTPTTAQFTTAQAATFQAATIGNSGAVLYGTLNSASAAQTNITSLGTLNGLTVASGYTVAINGTANSNGITYASGALQVAGGAGFASNVFIGGNLIVSGNVFSSTGNINLVTVTGNEGQFLGNAAGFGALFAGISSGYVYQSQTVIQASTNFNGYAQVNHQNINSGANASTDFVATMDTGSSGYGYIDMGINSSGFSNPNSTLSYAGDGYLYVQANATGSLGNLMIGTASSTGNIFFVTGGQNVNNQVMTITTSNTVVVTSAVASTTPTSGAMQVQGGLGVSGAIYAGGLINTSSTGTFGGGIQNTPIGNSTASSGSFTTLTTTTGNVTIGSAGGLVTSATTGYLFNETATTLNIGSAATTLNIGTGSGTITIANPTLVGSQTTQNVYNTVATTVNAFGAATSLNLGATSGTATLANPTVTLTNATALNLNGTSPSIATSSTGTASVFNTNALTGQLFGAATTVSIGNASGTTTISGIVKATGNLVAGSGTSSSSTTTGALIVNGGAGITGAVYAGSLYDNGSRVVTSVTLASGTGVTISSATTTGPSAAATVSIGQAVATTSTPTFAGMNSGGSILPSTTATYNLGSSSYTWSTVYGNATSANYADLAEQYLADAEYTPGTVVVFGGSAEITTTTEFADTAVAGAISTQPAHLMNSSLIEGLPLALRGRIPLKVYGPVTKGDSLVTSSVAGYAQSVGKDKTYAQAIFAKSLTTDLSEGEKVIEAVIL